jgi:EpsI family protein
MRDYRTFLPAAVLFIGCAFIWRARSQDAVPLATPLDQVLPTVPGYTMRSQQLSDDERRVAGMNQYIARVFSRDSVVAFSTFVSYYERQTQGKTIHSPRNCLPGAGWEILSGGPAEVPVDGVNRTLNRYILKHGAASAVVYYWYQGRGRVVANEYRVKWNLLRDAALAGHTEEALVRVVVFVRPQGESSSDDDKKALANASALGADIAARLSHDVGQALPRS